MLLCLPALSLFILNLFSTQKSELPKNIDRIVTLPWLKLYNSFFKNQNFLLWSQRSYKMWIKPTFPIIVSLQSSCCILLLGLSSLLYVPTMLSIPFPTSMPCILSTKKFHLLVGLWGQTIKFICQIPNYRESNLYLALKFISGFPPKFMLSTRGSWSRDGHGKDIKADSSLGGTVNLWWLTLFLGLHLALPNFS